MQELSDSIKRPNLRIMDIEGGEKVQTKGVHNIFNENFPNLEKILPIQYRNPPGHQIDLTKIELPHGILSKHQAQKTEKEF
jgi:hypothetical protein